MPNLPPNSMFAHDTSVGAVDEDKLRNAVKLQNNSSSPVFEQKYHDLLLVHKQLQQELKRLQLRDFNARDKDEGQSHHVVSEKFFDTFQLSTNWARDYFKVPFNAFQIGEHELFAENLNRVLCGGCQWLNKKRMNVSHLVQAVVAEVLTRRILLAQFAGCPQSVKHVLGQIYDAQLKENESKAYKWRASAFAGYELSGVWSPMDSSTPPESISDLQQKFYKEVADEIEEIVGPIARKHFPDRGDSEERFRRSMEFIKIAGDLAILLNRQAAKLEIMDKSWFERPEAAFVCKDERMKGRFMEEDEESEEGFQVDIILRPGFLKYGNDEGENLENYAVWIPAVLDLSEKGGYEDAPETMSADMPENNVTVPDINVGPEQSPPHLLDGHVDVVELVSTEPVSAEAAFAEPIFAGPAFAEPVSVEPASAEPVFAEPAFAESASAEPVVPLPPQQDQLHPQAAPQAEAAETEPKPSIHPGSGKSPTTTAQAGKANSQTEITRRRDVFWGRVKKAPKKLVSGMGKTWNRRVLRKSR